MIPNVDREAYYILKNFKPGEKITAKKMFDAIGSVAAKIDKVFIAESMTKITKMATKSVILETIIERSNTQSIRAGRNSINMNDVVMSAMLECGVPNDEISSLVTKLGINNSPIYMPLPGNILPNSLERVIVGRRNEIAKVAMMMNKKTRIIALIGGKGVGKNTVIHGVAKAIASGRFPSLQTAIIDLNEVLDDTYRQIEEHGRPGTMMLPTALMDNKQVYIYINHEQFARAVSITEGIPMLIDNGANIIICTSADYIKSLEKNANIVHHIEKMEIEEMPKKLVLEAVKIAKKNIEVKYSCHIPDDICEFTSSLSSRFPMETIQPGRTMEILEQCVAIKRLGDISAIDGILSADIEEMMRKGDVIKARELIVSNQDYILSSLKTGKITIDETDISSLMVSHLGISSNVPAGALTTDSVKQLAFLEDYVNKHVFGQTEAIKSVCDAIRRKALNITTEKSPPSFLFVGTTGTGKTYTAKKIAELMFGSEEALLRVDMSEFSEKHTISRLIGSPPGYVGYDDGGQLTDKVRKRPHSVVLLDEIEKAHKDVLNILLQILSDGRLTDGKGRTVSFRETIVIMTSNLGTKSDIGDIGFDAITDKVTKKNVVDSVKRFFSPELFNRIGKVVMYKALGEPEIVKIIQHEMTEASKNTKFKMSFTETVTKHIAEQCKLFGNVSMYGGREINRIVQEYLFNPITDKIMEAGKSPSEVLVDYDKELKVVIK